MARWFTCTLLVALLGLSPVAAQHGGEGEGHHDDGHGSDSRFSDEPIPLAEMPERPAPLIELGPKFLETGNINQGFEIPTGAVWTPAFMVFGNIRTAAQGIDSGVSDARFGEAVGRLDLFANLYLTQTERIVFGVSPLNENGQFTGFTFVDDVGGEPRLIEGEDGDLVEPDDFQENLNFRVRTLFFEGDLAELFPKLDWDDSSPLDYYISVGRQPLSFQDGILINEDVLDMVGLTRANLKIGGFVNTRVAGVFGWGDINRHSGITTPPLGNCEEAGFIGNCRDGSALLFGLFTETDSRQRTVELDAMYVMGDEFTGDGVYGGIGSTQRIGEYNSTLRVLGSYPVGDETPFNQAGALVHHQLGFTPHHTHNWAYINLYGAVGNYRSAARGPAAGGPLGQTGLLWSAVGIGRYGAALGNQADESVGGGIGYQMFFGKARRSQLVLEGGGRYTYGDVINKLDAAAGAAQYVRAIGRRTVFAVGGFGGYDFNASAVTYGARTEVTINF